MTRIAIFQARTGVDPVEGAKALKSVVAEAKTGGASMLFTPEMSGILDGDKSRARQSVVSESDDIVLAAAREQAAKWNIWIHLGSLALKADDGSEKFVNRGFVIDDMGEIRGRYDKIHLFDVDLPTGESWRESASYRRGEKAVIVPGTPVGNLGLAICYDLRFPALFERLSEAGADVISVPAAFTVPTGKAHWHILLRARAIEAGFFVVAAAQSGNHADGRNTFGHSLAIDPWGEILADGGEANGVIFADLELSRIAAVRERIPVLAHRRPIGPVSD